MKKLQFKIPAFAGMTALIATTSCASVIQGTTQEVKIGLEGAASAECTAKSAELTQKFTAPASLTVKRSYYPAEISCSADGQTGSVKIVADVSNWGYGGAVLGLGFGAGVDSATGAAFEYPHEIIVTMGADKTIGQTSMNSNKDF